MDVQFELEKELKRLQSKYNECQEYTVEWHPVTKKEMLPFNRMAELNGEVNTTERKLMIYCVDFESAMHTLRHEFFEAQFNLLVQPYVELYNEVQKGYENAFMRSNYCHKESFIEKHVQREEREIAKDSNPDNSKTTKKEGDKE
ncbi:MAG: hypothetical protein WC365_08055 [Candidatus Babeliales bacterium]|jgi:hypothetical protein